MNKIFIIDRDRAGMGFVVARTREEAARTFISMRYLPRGVSADDPNLLNAILFRLIELDCVPGTMCFNGWVDD